MIAVLMLIFGMQACKHHSDEPDFPGIEDDTTGGGLGEGSGKITMIEWPLRTVSEAGGQTHMKFRTSDDWTLAVSDETSFWISASPIEGNTDEQTVTFTIRENLAYEERNASFAIRCGSATQMITITQKQQDAIIITSDKIELDEKAQSFEVEVKSNVDYLAEVQGDAKTWLFPDLSKALKTNIMKFRVTANESLTPREGVIAFKSATQIEEVHVYQKGKKQTIVISTKDIRIPFEGGEAKVEIQSNTEYNELAPQNEWLLKDMDKSQSAYTLYYKASENTVKEPRSCILVFTSADRTAKDTVRITQEAFADKFEVVSDKEYHFKTIGGEFSVDVSSNTDYTISLPGDWITGDREGERGSRTHTFTVPRNRTYDPRQGEIRISNADNSITETIKVSQDEKVDGLNIISAPTQAFSKEAATATISFDASEYWAANVSAGARTWIKLMQSSGTEDITSMDIQLTANNTFEARSGVIIMTCGRITREIPISQNGIEPVLTINQGADGVSTGYEGGSVEIQVYSNSEYTIQKPDWLKGDVKGAPGNNRHVFLVPANSEPDDRHGQIIVTTTIGGKEAVIPVTQTKFEDILDILNVNFTTFAASGQDALVRFTTNKDWTATVSDNAKSWLTLNPRDGGKAGKNVDLVVVASMNFSFASRKGSVTISNGSKNEVLEFEQLAAEPTLNITQGDGGFDTDFHTKTIKIAVSANLDYNITTPAWIHGQTTGEAGDKTIFFEIEDNLTYDDRSGYIVLSNTEHKLRKEIPVKQGKKVETLKISANSLTFEKISPDKTLTVTASDPWKAEISAPARQWLSITSESGAKGITGMAVSVEPNPSFDIRTGTITFTCGREERVVAITQNAEVARLVITSEAEIKNINYKGNTIQVSVSSNCDYDISTPDWITGPASGKSGNSTHTFTVSHNGTYDSRTAGITFSNSKLGVSARVPVTQNKKYDEVYILQEPQNIMAADGGESVITFTANGDWTATGESFLTFSQASGGEGEHTITVTAGPNNTPVARTPRVTITCGTARRVVELTQTGEKPYITIQSSKILNVGAEANTIEIAVKANSKYTIVCPAWISSQDINGMAGTNVHTFSVSANSGTLPRTGSIQFKSISYNVNDQARITQEGAAE